MMGAAKVAFLIIFRIHRMDEAVSGFVVVVKDPWILYLRKTSSYPKTVKWTFGPSRLTLGFVPSSRPGKMQDHLNY